MTESWDEFAVPDAARDGFHVHCRQTRRAKLARMAGSSDDRTLARTALESYPDDLMHAQKVSTRVNSPKNNHVNLIEAVALDPGNFVRE